MPLRERGTRVPSQPGVMAASLSLGIRELPTRGYTPALAAHVQRLGHL